MMNRTRSFRLGLLWPAAFLFLSSAASAVTIDWVSVGGAGNVCDVQSQGCFGAVATNYRIAETICGGPTASANHANCGDVVGSYTGSASPNGTFDQGGNVWEWNEPILFGSRRGLWGGGFLRPLTFLAASIGFDNDPAESNDELGFRVASVPEPGTGLLVMTGLERWSHPKHDPQRLYPHPHRPPRLPSQPGLSPPPFPLLGNPENPARREANPSERSATAFASWPTARPIHNCKSCGIYCALRFRMEIWEKS